MERIVDLCCLLPKSNGLPSSQQLLYLASEYAHFFPEFAVETLASNITGELVSYFKEFKGEWDIEDLLAATSIRHLFDVSYVLT